MRKLSLIASIAAMALAMPAIGQGKGDKDGGKGGGKPVAEKQAGKMKDHSGHGGSAAAKPDKGAKAVREAAKAPKLEGRGRAAERLRKADKDFLRDREVDRLADGQAMRAAVACPPGLAKKDNGCLPPGQAKKVYALGETFQRNSFAGYNLPDGYRDFYSDNSDYYYRYDPSGYIYRMDAENDLVSGLIPLLGGGFAPGNLLPAGYDIYNVPMQYRGLYQDSGDSWYRYGDNAIYQVDPQSRTIESIVALLAGDLGVGQTLPAGYDVYNVPLDYRDTYRDTDDAWYRYNDGYVYQVDPQTRLIETAIQLLT